MDLKDKTKEITWLNSSWLLDSRRVLVSKEHKCVIFSDIHLGLYTAFRIHGSYLPAYDQDLIFKTLQSLITDYSDYHWIIAGDIMHSKEKYLDLASTERKEIMGILEKLNSNVKLTLLTGNHDLGLKELLTKSKFKLKLVEHIQIGNVLITHNVSLDEKLNDHYKGVIIGHIHPIATIDRLKGVKIPVFVVKGNLIVLPSFNSLSGGYLVNKLNFNVNNKKMELFGIINDYIIHLPT